MSFIKSNLELEVDKKRRDSVCSFWNRIQHAQMISRKGNFLGYKTETIIEAILWLQKEVGSKEPYLPLGSIWPPNLRKKHLNRVFNTLWKKTTISFDDDGRRHIRRGCGCSEINAGGWGTAEFPCAWHFYYDE